MEKANQAFDQAILKSNCHYYIFFQCNYENCIHMSANNYIIDSEFLTYIILSKNLVKFQFWEILCNQHVILYAELCSELFTSALFCYICCWCFCQHRHCPFQKKLQKSKMLTCLLHVVVIIIVIMIIIVIKRQVGTWKNINYTPVHLVESVKVTICAWERKRR